MTLGTHKKAPTEKSKVKKKQKNAFSLDDEVITFDITDPNQFISKNGDDDEIALTMQVWDSNRFVDDLLGEITISVLDFMEQESDAYGVLNEHKSIEWWPLTFTSKQGTQPAGRTATASRIFARLGGYPCHNLLRRSQLKEYGVNGKQDPYCKFTLGKAKEN